MFDASAVVGAALKADSVPRQALLLARERHAISLSTPVFNEISEVLNRPKLARALREGQRDEVLGLLTAAATWVEPTGRIEECRDRKDDKYLELAAAAGADVIVSSDADLLVMDPWRGKRILRPRQFLELTGS